MSNLYRMNSYNSGHRQTVSMRPIGLISKSKKRDD